MHFNLPACIPCCRYIQSTCATSGEGLYEGLDWLSSNIASKRCCPSSVVAALLLAWEHGLDTVLGCPCLTACHSCWTCEQRSWPGARAVQSSRVGICAGSAQASAQEAADTGVWRRVQLSALEENAGGRRRANLVGRRCEPALLRSTLCGQGSARAARAAFYGRGRQYERVLRRRPAQQPAGARCLLQARASRRPRP